jgi:hypothetical protein
MKRLTDEFLATAPPELKALAQVYPDQFAKAQLDNWEAQNKPLTGSQAGPRRYVVNGVLVDENGKKLYEGPPKSGSGEQWLAPVTEIDPATGEKVTVRYSKQGGRMVVDESKPYDTGLKAADADAAKVQSDLEKDWPKVQTTVSTVTNDLDSMAATATDLRNDKDLGSITGSNALLLEKGGSLYKAWNPGAARASAKLEKIKANAAFTSLQAMRAASPTGGAIGNVSDFEERLLTSSIAALDNAQSTEDFQTALDAVVLHTNNLKKIINEDATRRDPRNKKAAKSEGSLPDGWSQEEFDALTPAEKKELTGQ